MKLNLLLLFFILCGCSDNKFSGDVYDFDTEKPIKNVQITIHGAKTTTDVNGCFVIGIKSNSNCIIDLKREGYANKRIYRDPDNLQKGGNKNINRRKIYMFRKESKFSNKKK